MTPAEEAAERLRRDVVAIHDRNLGKTKYEREVRQACQAAIELVDRYEATREDEIAAAQRALSRELRAEQERREAAEKRADRSSPSRHDSRAPGESLVEFSPPTGSDGKADWLLAEVEGVLAAFREAGGEDDTPVRLDGSGWVKAVLPAPAGLYARREDGDGDGDGDGPVESSAPGPAEHGWRIAELAGMAAVVAVIVGVVTGLVMAAR